MSKEIKIVVKVQLPGGGANPSMVGTSLGPTGVNMPEFCQKFNELSRDRNGEVTPATILVYTDRTYDFTISQTTASILVKKAAGVASGSKTPHTDKVGHLTMDQLRAVAEQKMPDLNANDIDAAMKIIAGTARSIGITTDLGNEE